MTKPQAKVSGETQSRDDQTVIAEQRADSIPKQREGSRTRQFQVHIHAHMNLTHM